MFVCEEMCCIFCKVGFNVVEGFEVEIEYYCFDVFNMFVDYLVCDV